RSGRSPAARNAALASSRLSATPLLVLRYGREGLAAALVARQTGRAAHVRLPNPIAVFRAQSRLRQLSAINRHNQQLGRSRSSCPVLSLLVLSCLWNSGPAGTAVPSRTGLCYPIG